MKTLAGWLFRLRRYMTQAQMTKPRITRAPTREPTTMPAISPPVRPLEAPAAPVAVAVDVELKSSGTMDVIVGMCTFWHSDEAFELMQHESVAFGVLLAQKEQRPPRFDWYPQLSGSFSAPGTQVTVNEFGGRPQVE